MTLPRTESWAIRAATLFGGSDAFCVTPGDEDPDEDMVEPDEPDGMEQPELSGDDGSTGGNPRSAASSCAFIRSRRTGNAAVVAMFTAALVLSIAAAWNRRAR